MIIRNIILLIFLSLNFILCKGSIISGNIFDANSNDPLIGANIILQQPNNTSFNLGAATDVDGFYKISDIPIGNYTITVLYIGYETKKITDIKVKADQNYKYDFNLSPSAIQLQETIVTSTKRKEKITEAPASMEIISTRDIRREATSNIGSYLKGLKGVDYTASGVDNYSISVRGFNSSTSTRLLTLVDGRVASIPALKVINYSAIPQSTEDVENIEVVLGPATALYGANAYGGVVNITSKSPAQSEGLTFNVSGTADDRNILNINGRWAKKFNDWSMKISAGGFRAYEWEFIAEEEWKNHHAPFVGHPRRMYDEKDNNPWTTDEDGNGVTISEVISGVLNQVPIDTLNDGTIIYEEVVTTPYPNSFWGINNSGDTLLIGDGEPNHGDWDGDGLAGEDWFNGHDDDGDGLIDEDYFEADGLDNFEIFYDLNGNDTWDEGEEYEDWNNNGQWDGPNGIIDENIDLVQDRWYDGIDNDGNGWVDDKHERYLSIDVGPQWAANLDMGVLLWNGRVNEFLPNGEINPWHDPNADYSSCSDPSSSDPECHIFGDYQWDEDNFNMIFDTYIYDFGNDGLPGDPYEDSFGDGEFQMGETYTNGILRDCGLDGQCPTNGFFPNPNYPGYADEGEGDGEWQPGDRWLDVNGNGIIDRGIDGTDLSITEENFLENNHDLWPLANGIWDSGEIIYDCGNDGLCIGDDGYPGPDAGENDGILRPYDIGENDGMPEIGDGVFGGDGDYVHNYEIVRDINGDGIEDYPDFEVKNAKAEIRVDYDPNDDFNLSLQTGTSWVKTQQVTATSRYLTEGWRYNYYQVRSRYKNWFAQGYVNFGNSGTTRGYMLGNTISDASKNYAGQIQNNFNLFEDSFYKTKMVWGIDYFRTEPVTFGTILNDGPNGYDNDGDSYALQSNGIDDNGNGEIDEIGEPYAYAFNGIDDNGNGQIDEKGEGVDEPDEFDDVNSNELGLYFQSKTSLTPSKKLELVLASRLDYHEQLDEGLHFGPKIGLMYNPSDKYSFRMTYGKAYNTPTTNTMHFDLYAGKILNIFDLFQKGNKNGTPYFRNQADDVTTQNIGQPFYWDYNADNQLVQMNIGTYFDNEENYIANGGDPYNERINNAPFFFNMSGIGGAPTDWIPLDTSKYLVYIPEINGDGVLYSPLESINIPDIDPIGSETIRTFELGFKGRVGLKTIITADYYISHYTNFFSPATIITPSIVSRNGHTNDVLYNDIDVDFEQLTFAGIMPSDTIGSFYPYSTAWNGLDDDGDWEDWAAIAGWLDDDDGDGNPADRGEWGFTYFGADGEMHFLHPHEVDDFNGTSIGSFWYDDQGNEYNTYNFNSVGVDEWSSVTGLSEAELVPSAIKDGDGNTLYIPGRSYSPPHIILSSLNYGNVWTQGLDMSFTHFLTDKIIIDGNFSWYNTTDFYNELTKKKEPMNAPKFKWNYSFKWDSPYGQIGVNVRHVDQFQWNDGMWAGYIGPYDLVDINYNYKINKHLTFNITAKNIFNDLHKEMIGGAKLGRQIVFRMSSSL